jgi:phage shock protein E
MNSLFANGFDKLSARAGRYRPRIGFLSFCLLLVIGLMPFARGETNVASRAVMETNRVYVIDVRTEGEWKTGHIQNAILIPYDQIKERIVEVTTNKSASIALYCRSGRRSRIARESLQKLGYQNVEDLGSLKEAKQKSGISP